MAVELPGNVAVEDFGGDLVVTGPDLDEGRYRAILAELPEETRARVIGWKKTKR